MKRKRGPKKGHKKVMKDDSVNTNFLVSSPVIFDGEDTVYSDQNDDNSQQDYEDTFIEPDVPTIMSSVDSEQPIGKSVSRLKVKLKTSRVLEPHRSYSDVHTPSDTDKSNQQAPMELNNTAVEIEDSAFSDGRTSELQYNMSDVLPKKAEIKIKTSKTRDLSSESVEEKLCSKSDSPPCREMEQKQPNRDTRYSEKELKDSLMVIKDIMKMDSAEPFNSPVDPVALGIPDYFDYIETPMDFGTICQNLEHGGKYMNSEDVFKDVQLIWENCYTYNNKGDYIVGLMKRVKKHFMKCWMVAGLYLDKSMNGETDLEDNVTSSQDKFSKGKKYQSRKHGIDLHKSDCLCAVCVVRRRKKERDRENNLVVVESKMKKSSDSQPIERKSQLNFPSGDFMSSRLQSLEADINPYAKEIKTEGRTETSEQNSQQIKQNVMNDDFMPSMQFSVDNGNHEDSNKYYNDQEQYMNFESESGESKDIGEIHQQDHDEQRKREELAKRALWLENPLLQENHSILPMCNSLFPRNGKSVWSGPHSLLQRNVSKDRESAICFAMKSFMK